MRSFRLALLAASGLVVVLCLLHLFPLALVAAAVAVPILFLLYLWDVDLYEDAPLHRGRVHRRLGHPRRDRARLRGEERLEPRIAAPGRARARTTSSGSG